jgi:hypothetical protein
MNQSNFGNFGIFIVDFNSLEFSHWVLSATGNGPPELELTVKALFSSYKS